MSFSARTRHRLLLASLPFLLVVVALALVVRFDLPALHRIDTTLGGPPFAWTSAHHLALHLWVAVAWTFGTIPLTIVTVATVGVLLVRRLVRAAVYVAVVMAAASLTSTLLKLLMHRSRPVWPHPLQQLASYSFPSGHASGIASACGVAVVLSTVFVRRRNERRLVVAVAAVLVLLVGSDRVLLGVHNPSDVLAGWSVGFFWVLLVAGLHDPSPRPRRRETLASPVPRTKRFAVVLNPAKVEDVAGFRAMVERMAAEGGWAAPTWFETTVADPGRAMAEEAAISGAEMVLVCGGDGTVRTVCAELAGTGVPVGVVPAGTGNLLARNLGIPLFIQAAVDVALHGQDRAIDLVHVSGDGIPDDEHFMVMAGMGFDAAIMEGANEGIKARVGWLAYVVAGARNMMFPAVRLEISVDGGPWTRHRARTVLIGNVGYLQAGIPLLPDAAIDDGVLDVVLLSPRWFLSWVRVAVRVLSRARRTDDTLNRMTGRTISVRAAHDTPRQLDGDPIGPGRELRAVCDHGRLLVRVPV